MEKRIVCGHEIAGDNLDEREARIRRFERARADRCQDAVACGVDPDEAEMEYEEEHSIPLHLPECDARTCHGVYWDSREQAEAVHAVLVAAGFNYDVAASFPPARQALKAAGFWPNQQCDEA